MLEKYILVSIVLWKHKAHIILLPAVANVGSGIRTKGVSPLAVRIATLHSYR